MQCVGSSVDASVRNRAHSSALFVHEVVIREYKSKRLLSAGADGPAKASRHVRVEFDGAVRGERTIRAPASVAAENESKTWSALSARPGSLCSPDGAGADNSFIKSVTVPCRRRRRVAARITVGASGLRCIGWLYPSPVW